MRKVSVKDARNSFRTLLDRVASGEEIVIQRRGKDVARIVPLVRKAPRLPDLSDFRASIRVRGEPLSITVARAREEERY